MPSSAPVCFPSRGTYLKSNLEGPLSTSPWMTNPLSCSRDVYMGTSQYRVIKNISMREIDQVCRGMSDVSYLDNPPVQRRHPPLRPTHPPTQKTLPRHNRIPIPSRSAQPQEITNLGTTHPSTPGLDELPRNIHRWHITQAFHKVVAHHLGGLRWRELIIKHRFHDGFGTAGGIEVFGWRAEEVAQVSEQRDVIFDFLLAGPDPLSGKLLPHRVGTKRRNRVDGIEGIDGDAEAVNVIVFRSCGYKFEDPLSYRGVKETDANCRGVAGTAGLD